MASSNIEGEQKAKKFVKSNVDLLIEKFASLEEYPPSNKPFTLFMAGSPGAGKTEFSKSLVNIIKQREKEPIIRIDADEIRKIIPDYKGANAHILQGAAAIGVEKLFDHIQDNDQNAILDATFANYEKSRHNVERALGRDRAVAVVYIYQRPEVAWAVTKKRELVEKRFVPKEIFINAFLNARKNVQKVKNEFREKILLIVALKDAEFKTTKLHFDVEKVDKYLPKIYTEEELKKIVDKFEQITED